MRVEYKPENPAESGDGGRWEFDQNKVLGSHAEMIERRFGQTWEQFCVAVLSGSMKARRILLWYFRMREHPGYRLEDLPEFYTGELVVSYGVTELRAIREGIEKADWDTEQEKNQARMAVDVMLSEAMEEAEAERVAAGGGEVDEGEGKAPSPIDGESTGSRRPRSRGSSRGSGSA